MPTPPSLPSAAQARRAALAAAAALLLATVPDTLHAQFGRPDLSPPPGSQGWAPASAGFRAGFDYNSNGSVLGAQLRIPLLPGGLVEAVPHADVTFLTGLKEYQGGVELVAVSGGRRGGVYAGGGVAWRNTLWSGPDRETRRAPTAVVGLRSGATFGAPFGTQLEMRWTFPEGAFKPRVLSLGVNFPLWGRDR